MPKKKSKIAKMFSRFIFVFILEAVSSEVKALLLNASPSPLKRLQSQTVKSHISVS
jgi:hypothetical protein